MTDEELLAKVAKIEGKEQFNPIHMNPVYWDGDFIWNPLTNKAQAFELVEKYQMHISDDEEGIWDVNIPRRYGSYPGATNASLPRAILLAIVAANE